MDYFKLNIVLKIVVIVLVGVIAEDSLESTDLSPRQARSLIVESSSSVDIENILIKPYEQVCDQEASDDAAPELQIDQTRPECPLPLNSSSRQTGCMCDFDSSRIDCIYADRLARLPLFSSFPTTTVNSEGIQNISNIGLNEHRNQSLPVGISWIIDLRLLFLTYCDPKSIILNL